MPNAFGAFLGGSYPAQSPTAALERTINFYPEALATPGAKAPLALFPTPGVATFATAATSPVRALWSGNGRCFAVVGHTLYEVASNGALTSRGTVAVDVGTDPAQIVSNGDGGEQLLVCSGGHAYVYSLTGNTLTDVTVGSPAPLEAVAAQIAMLDGYFLVLDRTTSTIYQSGLYDGLSWDGLAFAQRAAMPDRWVALAVLNRDLWLLGNETSEVWYNAGTTPFAFAMHASGVVPWGCLAPRSVVTAGSTLLWLARTAQGQGQVVEASGLSVRVISTPALEHTLAGYATLEDAVACSYDERGHRFYVLTFPTAGATWVYDQTTGLWHERGTWDVGTAAYEAWRPMHTCQAFGKTLIGDREAGVIYHLDATHQTDVGGAVIRRVRRAPMLADANTRLFFTRFELDLEPGLGIPGGLGEDPTVTLRYSNDGGKTWATAGDRTADSGAQGQYRTRVFWLRLGSARQRVFEVVMSDPAPWRLVGAFLDLRVAEGT
ncbi:MAG TPA: hypothetical protein PKC83_11020 [Gemmatimonadaceae bacterium]|nr:hypothetical protein [Gemmatimonadaceae bacterium]